MSLKSKFKKLASVCGQQKVEFLSATGILSVVYIGQQADTTLRVTSPSGHGFIGYYYTESCPGQCRAPSVCKEGRCVCPVGYHGPLCRRKCPDNCFADVGQGYCDKVSSTES